MSESKHTPKWFLTPGKRQRKRRQYEHGESYLLMGGDIRFRIATIEGPSNDTSKEELFANARLIAAAPDLLAALERAEMWSDLIESDGYIDGSDLVDWLASWWYTEVKPALAKARGEEATV